MLKQPVSKIKKVLLFAGSSICSIIDSSGIKHSTIYPTNNIANITTTTIDGITIAMAMYGTVGFETLTTNNWYGAVNDNEDKKNIKSKNVTKM
jgi:ribosomal protein S11